MRSLRAVYDLGIISLITLLVTLAIWLPHILAVGNFYNLNFSEGFNSIYRNYDGLEYVIIAKTWYLPEALKTIPQSLPEKYYAAHFPGYALAIAAFAPLVGFLKSMILTSMLFTVLAAWAFYLLVRDFKLTDHPLLLSIIFLILPARWLVVHSVGSSEPMFIFLVLLSVYYFMKYEARNSWSYIYLAGIFGMLAQLTRPPGILLFGAYGLYILFRVLIVGRKEATWPSVIKKIVNFYPLLLIPMMLVLIFYWYQIAFNDFWAYFNSGDNIHLAWPPFQVFNKEQFWVGEVWLEDVIYVFMLGLLGGFYLFKQRLYAMSFFVLIYLTATMLVAHRDISRYALPIFPFLLIGFEKMLVSREFRIALIVVGLGIYLYAQNFLLSNTGPYPNLEIFN